MDPKVFEAFCILTPVFIIFGLAELFVIWKYWGYKWRWTKKFLAPFLDGSQNEYVLIGVYGINYWHLRQKIKRLRRRGITVETRFGTHREVNEFPDYCDWIF